MDKFSISLDPEYYHAFPDVALTKTGRLVCVISECMHHGDRSYTRIVYRTSDDRGRTWSAKRALTQPLRKDRSEQPHWNCPRITALGDGRLVAVVDQIAKGRDTLAGEQTNWLLFSEDNAESWSGPYATPIQGIVPDQVVELRDGSWIVSAHTVVDGVWTVRCWISFDQGSRWEGPHTIAAEAGLKLCEGSIFELGEGTLCCLLRENSFDGQDAYKAVSADGGRTWSRVVRFALPGCHRPVGGLLQDGQVLVTYRFLQGGGNTFGKWTQNFFGALTDVSSCLAEERQSMSTRIFPIDYDRSPVSDTGYSGWVQFSDGEVYVVNYIVDDAPRAQVRGYSFRPEELIIESGAQGTNAA